MKKTALLLVSVLICFISNAQIIHVPQDQPTIQAGIDVANNGDLVLVDTGTYYENINFYGKAITVASNFIMDGDTSHISNTIIDGSQPVHADSASVVSFISGEDTTSIIQGFTITGGSGSYNTGWEIKYGGGIVCWNAGAKILNNNITGNHIADPLLDCGGAGIGSIKNAGTYWIFIKDNKITNNSANTNNATSFGGGIYVATNAIIRNNTIEQNSCYSSGSQVDGGGIMVQEVFGNTIIITIDNNIIKENALEGFKAYGAGINLYKTTSSITNNIINKNSLLATDRCRGGGLFVKASTKTIRVENNEITDNFIEANNPATGGGIAFRYIEGNIELINNLISGNSTTSQNSYKGPGMYFYECTGQIGILNNYISDNSGTTGVTNGAGGGICLWGSMDSKVLVDGNQFIANESWIGGGFFSADSYNLLLTNNIFSGNSSGKGGGMAFQHTSKNLNSRSVKNILVPQIINNTFYDNTAKLMGGAIRLNCEFNIPLIFNCIFWENQAPDGKDIYTGTAIITVSYSDIDTLSISGLWTGDGNINVDPKFIDPVAGNYCIDSCTSPCAGSGIDTLFIDEVVFYLAPDHDILGRTRPIPSFTQPDMGAYEVDSCVINDLAKFQVSNFKFQIYPNPTNGISDIRYQISDIRFVLLDVYNIHGQKISMLVNEKRDVGEYVIRFDGSDLSAGIYFVRLQAGDQSESTQLIITR